MKLKLNQNRIEPNWNHSGFWISLELNWHKNHITIKFKVELHCIFHLIFNRNLIEWVDENDNWGI